MLTVYRVAMPLNVTGCEMLELGANKINAVSVGGLETCIELPAWKLCFDIGRCPPTSVRLPRVLFTHAHMDHMGGVTHHCAQRDLMGMAPPTYFVPQESASAFEEMMAAWRTLSHSALPAKVVPVTPGQRIDLGRQQWARVFRSIHRIPSVGYVVGTVRNKLVPEFEGKPPNVIRQAVKAGISVNREVETAEIAFCGDTCIDVLKREECVRKARILILEVTFLDDRVSVESARENGHVHLDEVIEHAELFENEHVLLTHFSSRYTNHDIQKILAARLPASLKGKMQPLMFESPWA